MHNNIAYNSSWHYWPPIYIPYVWFFPLNRIKASQKISLHNSGHVWYMTLLGPVYILSGNIFWHMIASILFEHLQPDFLTILYPARCLWIELTTWCNLQYLDDVQQVRVQRNGVGCMNKFTMTAAIHPDQTVHWPIIQSCRWSHWLIFVCKFSLYIGVAFNCNHHKQVNIKFPGHLWIRFAG